MRVGSSSLAVAAVALALTGCGDGNKDSDSGATAESTPAPKIIQPGAPGEPSREVVATPTVAGEDGHTKADIEFMQGMIHHHQQAVVMTEWVPDRTQSTSLRLMAKRIEVSQGDEMNLMRTWLEKRGVDPNDHSHMHKAMPGMVNSRQLRRLKEAKGVEFDRLFLRYMTQHHQGALTMVQQLVDKGGGSEVEIGQFILHVDADQSIEIKRMAEMAKKL
jgi:uncharacterized protein (DUF305 family)